MNRSHQLNRKTGPASVSVQKVGEYPFHWDDNIEIILVLEGSITMERGIWTQLMPHVMHKGDIFAFTIDEMHRIYADEQQDNLVLMLHIDGDFVRNSFPSITVLEFDFFFEAVYLYFKKESERIKIHNLIQLVLDLAAQIACSDGQKPHEVEKRTSELLLYLIDNFNRINAILNMAKNKKHIARTIRIASYIITHSEQKNLVREIAEREHFNPKFISQELKKGWYLSIQELTSAYRVIKAAKMLLETDKNISDIAYECGFSAPRYFYKHFKSYCPSGPAWFRSTYQEGHQNIKYLICCQDKIDLAARYLPAIRSEPPCGDGAAQPNINDDMPSLLLAQDIQDKAARAGFCWPDESGSVAKLDEEIAGFRAAATPEKRSEKLGDVLFAAVNMARSHHIDAEEALLRTSYKFIERIRYFEDSSQERGLTRGQASLEQPGVLQDETKERGL